MFKYQFAKQSKLFPCHELWFYSLQPDHSIILIIGNAFSFNILSLASNVFLNTIFPDRSLNITPPMAYSFSSFLFITPKFILLLKQSFSAIMKFISNYCPISYSTKYWNDLEISGFKIFTKSRSFSNTWILISGSNICMHPSTI